MNFLKKFFSSDVKVGDAAPDFTLTSQTGAPVKLSELVKKSCVVLYFYPKDNTHGCIAESCAFRDQYEVFKGAGAEVVGISSDGPESHAQFASQYKLPFILVSDTGNMVRKLYGVPNTMGIIPGRVTYVIDKTGTVRHVFNSQFNPTSHVEQALTIIKGCQAGCG